MKFAYRGNIEELFPELVAFLIFTIAFTFPLSVSMLPFNRDFVFPHETMTIGIHVAFICLEIILGLAASSASKNKTRASFHLRTAPLVDIMFKKKYRNAADVGAVREI